MKSKVRDHLETLRTFVQESDTEDERTYLSMLNEIEKYINDLEAEIEELKEEKK